jgi:hypothetical protein
MKNFKLFLEESTQSGVHNIESLPFVQGHTGVSTMADMFHGLHTALLGKKADVKTKVNLKGLPISFGINPQNKMFFVSNGGKDSHSQEEIQTNHGDNPELARKMSAALEHIPKIMNPRNKGMYSGKVLFTHPDEIPPWLPKTNASIGLAIEGDHTGKLLTDSQKSKFEVHPDVYNVNPSLRGEPLKYDIEKQKEYKFHMTAASKAYGKMDPDALDTIKDHKTHIQKYINGIIDTGEKPSVQGYGDYLAHSFTNKQNKKDDIFHKDKMSSNFDKLSDQLHQNPDHFTQSMNMLHPLHMVRNVLSDVAANNNNPGDVSVYKGVNTAVLKKRKV